MSKRAIELFLFDVLVAILKIEKTVERFENSQQLLHEFNAWDSVIREFEIIGEATKYLLDAKIIKEENRVVVDFRNLLIHNYFGVDSQEVWDVVQSDLPEFKNEVVGCIANAEQNLRWELIDAYCTQNRFLEFVVKYLENLR
ncbi:MAG: hypothetical protein QG558_333 [Campylobacterota bacterium]|nr:hypothetical protein [Campylobacterota bacterium]